jgi:choline-sulfatase
MAAKRPNILILMTDQQRADTIAALGNKIIKTPHLDELARTGTSFTRAYTPAPICSPARIALATGLPPHVHRFTDHDWWHWEPEDGPRVKSPHESSFMTDLHDAGYQTFMTGKLHYSGRGWLMDGVEEFAGGERQISSNCKRLQSYEEFCQEKGYKSYGTPWGFSSEFYMEPQRSLAPPEHTMPHFLADRSIDFLQRRDTDRPFMLCCHFPGPHPPICNPLPWAHLYRAREMHAPHRPENYKDYQARTNRYQNRYKGRDTAQEDDTGYRALLAAYYANISHIDYNIGRILDALGEERDNTLILFTTDHGEMMGDYGCNGKRCMLEASIRVPMIVSWPGTMPADARCDTAVSLLDIYPTILHAAGIDDPKRSEETRSMLDVGRETTPAENKRIVFSQFSSGWCGQYAATDGEWKYMYSAPDRKEWLFRLRDELVEGPNRIDAPDAAEPLARLKGALLQRHDPSVDPWSNAVENGQWKPHTPPPETYLQDPTYGYLNQDQGKKGDLQADIDALGPGYARKVTGLQVGSLHGDHAVCGGQCPFEIEEEVPSA